MQRQCAGGVLDGGGGLLVAHLDDIALVHPRHGQRTNHQRNGVVVGVGAVIHKQGVGCGHTKIHKADGDGTRCGVDGQPIVLAGTIIPVLTATVIDVGVAGGDVGGGGADTVHTELVAGLPESEGTGQHHKSKDECFFHIDIFLLCG